MTSKTLKLIFLFFSLTLFAEQKKAYIISGPESSGSTFIARVIAHVVGKDPIYKEWSGRKWNGDLGDDVVILHLSQPAGKEFYDLAWFQKTFADYDRYFILTTRDVNIIKTSKKKRFKRTKDNAISDQEMSKNILSDIIKNEKFFIWNFETQIYLKESYFQLLYDFLEVKSNFFPPDLTDANAKHIDADS
ncbi:MAG TPA: hypothetical protein VJK48_02505 [Chlamydiales bacterium]|nr:MAG: hypothetical protein A3F67_07665 [Verrucomicrobia bacterium RIFCSPHIGHO2_12_FULL_41_10]HLB52564.1 hypothetical protein [Chlamydiales bacterium]